MTHPMAPGNWDDEDDDDLFDEDEDDEEEEEEGSGEDEEETIRVNDILKGLKKGGAVAFSRDAFKEG